MTIGISFSPLRLNKATRTLKSQSFVILYISDSDRCERLIDIYSEQQLAIYIYVSLSNGDIVVVVFSSSSSSLIEEIYITRRSTSVKRNSISCSSTAFDSRSRSQKTSSDKIIHDDERKTKSHADMHASDTFE